MVYGGYYSLTWSTVANQGRMANINQHRFMRMTVPWHTEHELIELLQWKPDSKLSIRRDNSAAYKEFIDKWTREETDKCTNTQDRQSSPFPLIS